MERIPTSTREHERQPERQPFNIDAMTNDEIIELGRALSIAADVLNRRKSADEDDSHLEDIPDRDPDAVTGIDDLWDKLQTAVRELPARDLTRARELLSAQMSSQNEHDHTAAAEWADGFHGYDYDLARDTLVRLYADHTLPGYAKLVSETAMDRIGKLYDTRLTPEQKADYDARLAAYGLTDQF